MIPVMSERHAKNCIRETLHKARLTALHVVALGGVKCFFQNT